MFRNRSERVTHATSWNEFIREEYKEEIKASIDNTDTYGVNALSVLSVPMPEPRSHAVKLMSCDSVTPLFDGSCSGRTCILNFASYKNPGGFFLGGSAAQEEALCHESTLFPVLESFEYSYYSWNRQHLNRALYQDRALYSKDIMFVRDGKVVAADVLTCAAPNWGTAFKYQNVSRQENDQVLAARSDFIGRILKANKVDTFIAGAWGCGVFQQDAWTVADKLCVSLYDDWKVPNLIFAVPAVGASKKNYDAFERYLR